MAFADRFTNRDLTELMVLRPRVPNLFRELFFSSEDPITSTVVEMEMLIHGRSLVPFVSDYAGGTVVTGTQREVAQIKTPRLRPKRPFSAPDLLNETTPGKLPYGVKSREELVEEKVVQDLDKLNDDLDFTIEWLAAQALTGTIRYTMDSGKEVVLDLRIPAGNKIVLTGDDCWNGAKGNPYKDLDFWNVLVGEGGGVGIDCLVMGANAWAALKPLIKDDLDNKNLNVGQISESLRSRFKGYWNGCEIWVYSGFVTLEDGSVVRPMDPDCVIATSRAGLQSKVTYGLPMDYGCEGPTTRFVKSHLQEDPSVLEFIAESRPLPWMKNPGGVVYARVINKAA